MKFNARKSEYVFEYLLKSYMTPLVENKLSCNRSDFLLHLLDVIHPCSVFRFEIDKIVDKKIGNSTVRCFIKLIMARFPKLS